MTQIIKNNEILNNELFIFLFIIVILYRGKYSFPLNSSIHNFIQNNKIIIYFIILFSTFYLLTKNMVFDKNDPMKKKFKTQLIYLLYILFLSILFLFFTKINIYSIFTIVVIVIIINILKLNIYSYIIPTIIIIGSFFYEYVKFNNSFLKFLET